MLGIVFTLIIVGFTIIFLKAKYRMSYWRRLGIPEEPGFFPFGSQCSWEKIRMKKSRVLIPDEPYKNHPGEKLVGLYGFLGEPSLVIRDPDLIQRVFIKDFDHFSERLPTGGEVAGLNSESNKYLAMMLFQTRGDDRRRIRNVLAPIFNVENVVKMIPSIHGVANECILYLEQHCGEDLNMKDVFEDFAVDTIMSTGFGTKCNSFAEPDNPYKHNALLLTGKIKSPRSYGVLFLYLFAPKLIKWLDISFFNKDAKHFFVDKIRESIEQRKKERKEENNLLGLFVDAIAKEYINPADKKEGECVLIGNLLVMFLGGVDTLSTLASIVTHYLCKHQDVQENIYQEISTAVKQHGDKKLDYEKIAKLSYLEMVILESQRCYPISAFDRVCSKKYKFPGTDLVIPKDFIVHIPMSAITKDELYFESPNQFNPENFNAANKAKRHPCTRGGFGQGSRSCIASLLATIEVKLIIARIVEQFRILPNKRTVKTLVPEPKSHNVQPKGGFWFTVEKRDAQKY